MKKPLSYLELVKNISDFPMISSKAAEKIALFFLDLEKIKAKEILTSMIDSIYKINKCKNCNIIVEGSLLCDVCLDDSRDKQKICILSNFNNLLKIEETNIYDGRYFVLEFDIKPNSKGLLEEQENILMMLESQIKENDIREILVLLDFTISGELTSYFLSNYLKDKFKNIKIYRPAIGMPVNSSIDYIDQESLEWSIKNKKEI